MRHASLAARTGLLIISLALGACRATRSQQSAGEVIDDEDPVAKARDVGGVKEVRNDLEIRQR